MAHDDQVSQWDDLSGQGNHAVQVTPASDMPKWSTANSGADIGGLNFANSVKWFDLTETIELTGDFTIMMRFRLVNVGAANRTFVGDSTDDWFQIVRDNKDSFKLKINGTVYEWEDTSATDIEVGDPDYRQIITITRSSGALSLHVNGGTSAGGWNNQQDDVDWDSAETHSTTDTFTITNIGAAADDAFEFNGFIYDTLVYATVLSEVDRKLNYDYLNAQTL